jgi:hypothetical protein
LKGHITDLERLADRNDADPDDLMALFCEMKAWLVRLLDMERSLNPSVLPPGLGALYSIDYLMEEDNDDVIAYIRLLNRLDQIEPNIRGQVRAKRMFEAF